MSIDAEMEESPGEGEAGPKRVSVSLSLSLSGIPRVEAIGFTMQWLQLSTGSWMKGPMSLIQQKQLEGGWLFKTKRI